MRLRSRMAVFCAKVVQMIIMRSGRGRGSTLPGYIARRIDPRILSVLSAMVRDRIIAVTGTNGKTTVNRIICQGLEAEGRKVVCNRLGANLPEGVISAFVQAADWSGNLRADYACLEVDELSAPGIFPELEPDLVLVTNLFRDQLDRAGEVDSVCRKLESAMGSVPEAKLAVNCDDICSLRLALDCGNPVVTYGISEKIAEDIPCGSREMVFCPLCGKKLEYDFFQYGQLGIYRCRGCGLKRPEPDVQAGGITFRNGRCSCRLQGISVTTRTQAPYSVYNTLAAYAALEAVDGPRESFPRMISGFDYGNNRENLFVIGEARVQLYLAKNPVGFQQKIFLLGKDPECKDVVIQINDSKLDGEDISWLWDVDYRYLARAGASSITAGGARGEDMKLCLEYEDIPCEVTGDIRGTVEELTVSGSKNIYFITNYSGLYAAGRMLDEMQSGWKAGPG